MRRCTQFALPLAALFVGLLPCFHPATAQEIAAAAPGLAEAGPPPFVVVDAQALGLDAPPTGLRLLPDGRVLLFAPRQLALGDGIRWQVYRQAPTDPLNAGANGVIDAGANIFVGVPEGGAQVHFEPDGHWRLELLTPWSEEGATPPVRLPQASVTETTSEWIWHSLTGLLVAWRPGHPPRTIGKSDTFETVFAFRDELHLSERFNGRVSRLRDSGPETILTGGTSTAITCAEPFDADRLLVGTYGAGLHWFDGTKLTAFPATGVLANGARINDLCAAGHGFFAASIDNFGVVFFTPEGRIVQTLDRSSDHRLSRVRQLVATPDGVLWGLLDTGLVRIHFPTRVSNFEPLIGSGVTTVHPFRVEGKLWLLVDGRVQRAVYGDDGQLAGLALDSPANLFVNSFSGATGWPVAGTEHGAFFRTTQGWEAFAPATDNLRILDPMPVNDRWLYAARDEVGWIAIHDGRPTIIERFPAPGLTNAFNHAIVDRDRRIWLELGSERVGLVQVVHDRPEVRILTGAAGVPPSWPQIFALDGVVGFNFAQTIYRFDDQLQRLVPAPEFVARFAGISEIYGRPTRDATGRVWLTAGGNVRVFAPQDGRWHLEPLSVPVNFPPYYFTPESNGVMWMHAQYRLARFDPAMPEATPAPLTAVITQITLTSTGQCLFPLTGELRPLNYEENSLLVQFMAPGNPFTTSVTFDVKLDGAGTDWTPAGSAGSAVFNHLKEGRYHLHVRPRAGSVTGEEASLAFSVRPPWYRTPLAYAGYVVTTLGILLAVGLGWSLLARREKSRLERLVTARTAELRSSERHVRQLNEELEQRVAARTAELNLTNDRLLESNRELEAFSYSVSHDLRTPLRNIRGFADLLRRRSTSQLDAEGNRYVSIVSAETARLGHLIDSLLNFSRLNQAEMQRATIDPAALIVSVRAELANDCAGRNIEWRIDPLPPMTGDATLLRQVFANLIGNAVKFTRGRDPAVITISSAPAGRFPNEITYFIRDNGAGFDPKYADKLFGVFQRLHGGKDFEGSGIGLAIVRRIIARHGGHTWAEGVPEGGATFFFSLPQPSQRSGPNAS